MRTMERNKFLLEEIKKLKGEQALWGYRKVWAYLKYREGLNINKKRIYRLMKKEKLLVTKDTKLKAKRAKFPYKPKPKAIKPNQIWGIDMTKILIQNAGWMYLHVVLDWFTKKIAGFSLSFTSKTGDWLNALNNRFPLITIPKVMLIHKSVRTLKEDLIWIKEFTSPEELKQDLERWIYNYNVIYFYSSLNYKTPLQFEVLFSFEFK